MTSPGFITAEKVAELSTQNPERLFPPFAQSIAALFDVLSSNPGLTSDAQNAKMKDRMDFNEAGHPRDENGQFAEGEGSSSAPPKAGLRYLLKVKMLRAKGLQTLKRRPFISPNMALSSDS